MASTVWKGHLAFGLVSVPVKLTCAARADGVSFNQLRASDHSRVGQRQYAKADDKPISKDEIVKGFEVSPDKYVVVSDEELKALHQNPRRLRRSRSSFQRLTSIRCCSRMRSGWRRTLAETRHMRSCSTG